MRENPVRKYPLLFRVGIVFMMSGVAISWGGCGSWVGSPVKKPDTSIPPEETVPDNRATLNLAMQGNNEATSLAETEKKFATKTKTGDVSGSIYLTDARIVLNNIRLKKTGVEASDMTHWDGPFVVNLLTHEIHPQPQALSADENSYDDLEVSFAKLDKNSDLVLPTDPLLENSLYLEGRYENAAGESKVFRMASAFVQKIRFSDSSAFALKIDASTESTLLLELKMSKWFDFSQKGNAQGDIDFSSISENEMILGKDAKGTSEHLAKKIEENIRKSFQSTHKNIKKKPEKVNKGN